MSLLRASTILDPELESRPATDRIAYLEDRLRRTIVHAYANAARFRAAMDAAGVSPRDIHRLGDLAKVPITRKDELPAIQAQDLPFGGLAAVPTHSLKRIFVSPGNIYDLQGQAPDFWRFRPALAAAGFRAGDVVLNTFAYHLTPAGFMLDAALGALGCVVVPSGPGNTETQVRIASDLGATGYVGTPSFLYTILKRAAETRSPLQLEVAWVTAEMLPESLRHELETDYGIRVLQGYGTADLGLLAYECLEKKGMHLHPEVIVEILDLETQEPAPPGQPGLVVATIFDETYPLVRFATGDLSMFLEDHSCACGRTAPKLAGILGRIGDAVKVKGMFVRGSQMEEVMKRFPEVARFQAVVTREAHQDRLRYIIELNCGVKEDGLKDRLAEALRGLLHVRGEVELVPPGTIPAGARKIDDQRVWK
ncbi:MAG TPA: AMP-binding protein [Terriglobales bacterium]|nr:AMP-binding protein [Terriglobales bacterium]